MPANPTKPDLSPPIRRVPRPLQLLSLASVGILPLTAATGGPPTSPPHLPIATVVRLSSAQLRAAREGRLGLAPNQDADRSITPAQWSIDAPSRQARATWLGSLPGSGEPKVRWRTASSAFPAVLQAIQASPGGHIDLVESGRPVLRYNYQTVEPGDLLAQIAEGNRIYARARSDYLHPLYGIHGECLTRDWSVDHPHHRGIYWAWPEVDYGKERGDLHALQRVFARPTGQVRLASGPVFAEVEAENLWLWEDRDPIAREFTLIRAYAATPAGRMIDLAFRFVALKEGVTLARRGTDKYGGLNIRLATPEAQSITAFTAPPNHTPRRAWSDLSGKFPPVPTFSGLTVFQLPSNPEYPGEWIQYPDLSWCQPTFPTAGTRYALSRHYPLELRYRLWIHPGGKPTDPELASLWDTLCLSHTARPAFQMSPLPNLRSAN